MSANKVAEWLKSLPNVSAVHPCRVAIEKETWEGAWYQRTGTWRAGMQGVQNGTHKEGETYEDTFLYLVGHLPKVAKRKKCCYVFGTLEWFVASYSNDKPPLVTPYHPFGNSFQLKPWSIPNSKVDDGERSPYRRVPMTVEWLD